MLMIHTLYIGFKSLTAHQSAQYQHYIDLTLELQEMVVVLIVSQPCIDGQRGEIWKTYIDVQMHAGCITINQHITTLLLLGFSCDAFQDIFFTRFWKLQKTLYTGFWLSNSVVSMQLDLSGSTTWRPLIRITIEIM